MTLDDRSKSCLSLLIPLLLLALVAGCRDTAEPKQVRLNTNLQPVGVAQVPQVREKLLKVAIAPVISPRASLELYEALLENLGQTLGIPVQAIQRRTYGEVNELLQNGGCDVAFICTYAYVQAQQEFGLDLLAAPEVRGRSTYQSYLIVPADSPVAKLTDLRDKQFAFSDPLSNSGWLYPRFLLAEMGTTPDQFFSRYLFTYSHDNTLRAVADGLVDGGAIDSLVYEQMIRANPADAQAVRVIRRSPEFPTPPVVARTDLSEELKRRVQAYLLRLHTEPDGQAILQQLDIDRFVPIQDEAYAPLRQMIIRIEETP